MTRHSSASPVWRRCRSTAAARHRLLIAESLAVEKAVAPDERSDICCSLHRLPLLLRLVDRGEYVRLSWRELDELVGPDAEMIAADPDEQRRERNARSLPDDMSPEEAEAKLVEMAEEIYEMRSADEE